MPRPYVLLASLLAACPQANQADPAAGAAAPTPVSDARVIADSGDLYPAKGGVPSAKATPPPPSPGTGISDETNGKCRLFAPEMPNPRCCERQLGFDADAVQAACDLKIYLGESFQGTCGYHFVADAAATGMPPRWFRLSVVAEKTVQEAAAAHDKRTSKIDNYVPMAPIPGIDGAMWAEADELHWAYLPGWRQVRMFTWSESSCSPAGIEKILRQLIATPEIPAGTPRAGLVPGRVDAAPSDGPNAGAPNRGAPTVAPTSGA